MSAPTTKIKEAVGREVEDDKSGSDSNDKGLCSVFNYFLSVMKPEMFSLQFWCSLMLMCLCYASVIVPLFLCYCLIMLLLYFHRNEILTQLYSLSYDIYMVLQIIM